MIGVRHRRRWPAAPILLALLLVANAARSPAPHATQTPAAHTAPLAFNGLVVDQAELLDTAARDRITARLDHFQQQTGHQLVVVTVRSLGGIDISTFTQRLANRWGVGRRGVNDGIVLLVAPHERKTRIAVGTGLEHILTNAICAGIIADPITPAFVRGDFASGIEAGVVAITTRFETPPPAG